MTHFVAQGVRKPAQGVRKPAPASAGGGVGEFNRYFCLRLVVVVVVVVVLLLGQCLLSIFFRYGQIYKITFLDNIDVMNCANFGYL